MYVQAWYIAMCKAMDAGNVALVLALWQMGLTTSVQVWYGLTTEQLTLWSLQCSERVRSQAGLIVDTFHAFALKCLNLLPAEITERKAAALLHDAGVTWNGARPTQAIANAVLCFRRSLDDKGQSLLPPPLRQRGASSSSHGPVGGLSVGTMSVRAQGFKHVFDQNLQMLAGETQLLCLQEIDKKYSQMVAEKTNFEYTHHVNKTIAWDRACGIQLVLSEWRQVYLDSAVAALRNRGVLCAAHCLMWVKRPRGAPSETALASSQGSELRWQRLRLRAWRPLNDEIVAAANAAHSERYGRHKETKGDARRLTWRRSGPLRHRGARSRASTTRLRRASACAKTRRKPRNCSRRRRQRTIMAGGRSPSGTSESTRSGGMPWRPPRRPAWNTRAAVKEWHHKKEIKKWQEERQASAPSRDPERQVRSI